jgi:hypothetical protein
MLAIIIFMRMWEGRMRTNRKKNMKKKLVLANHFKINGELKLFCRYKRNIEEK